MALRDAQKSIADWIRAPEGVAAALAEEDARGAGAESGAATRRLDALVRGDGVLDATGRLEIYANAYFHRLLEVLAADYAVLRDALGRDAFHDLVTSYLLVAPSRHPSLRFAGDRLASFLAAHEAAAGIRARAPWAADLAALEWARVQVFDAADGAVLTRTHLESLAPEAFASLELRLGAWAVIGRYEHAVDELWRDPTRGAVATQPERNEATAVLIWRKEEVAVHRRLSEREAAALEGLAAGMRFDVLCEWTATEVGESEAPTQAAVWLERWLADGALAAPASASGLVGGAPTVE